MNTDYDMYVELKSGRNFKDGDWEWNLTTSRFFSGMREQVKRKSESLELCPRLFLREALSPQCNGVGMC
jgi:hypothetical protein